MPLILAAAPRPFERCARATSVSLPAPSPTRGRWFFLEAMMGENGNGNGNGLIRNMIVALLALVGTALITIDGFLSTQVLNHGQEIAELKSSLASRKESNDAIHKAQDVRIDQLDQRQIVDGGIIAALRVEVTELEKQTMRITDVDIAALRSALDTIQRHLDMLTFPSDGQQREFPGKHP
jgi:hypothetical protein